MRKGRKGIVVVGSSNTDMVVKVPTLPAPGETVLGGRFVIAAGGKGANQAVAAARLGGDVTFVCRLGTDMFGERSLERLKKEGLNTRHVVRDESSPSGVALIMVDERGENLIAVAPGANGQLSVEDAESAREAIALSSVLLLQLEIPLDTVRRAARLGKEAGAVVILNPAPARPLDDQLMQEISILTPNAGEAKLLTGIEPRDPESCWKAATLLRNRGVESVVITLGREGAFLSTGDHFELIPGRSVEAVDATAAGDAFNGALAHGLASGKELREAVELANRAAALSVTRLGAQPSLPTRKELESFSAS
jgi:ribokinase